MSSSITDHLVSFNDHTGVVEHPNGKRTLALRKPKLIIERRVMNTVLPASAINGAAFFGSSFDFRLEQHVDKIDEVFLRMTVTAGGAGATIGIPHTWFQQYAVYGNSGGTQLFLQSSPSEIYTADSLNVSMQQFETSSALRGQDESYSITSNVLAANEVRTYMIPVACSFFKACKIRPYQLTGNLLIRFWTESLASCVSAGAITFNDVSLRVLGSMETDIQKRDILSKTLPHHLYFFSQQRHIQTISALAANTTVSIKLSGIMASAATVVAFRIQPVANISNPALKLSFTPIAEFEIVDSANNSLVGYNPITTADHLKAASRVFPNKFVKFNNVYVWSFSDNPVFDEYTGNISGLIHMTGFESIRVKTTAAHVPGDYIFECYAFCAETAVINRGMISASRS